MSRILLLLVLALGAAAPVRALQAGAPSGAPLPAGVDGCPEGRIAYVHIDNASIFDDSDPNLDKRFGWAYRAANALHVRTRDWVIRRELLFQPGDCFSAFLAGESERILRNYNFLSEVDIYPVPQPDSTVHVIVDTRDEWSTRVDVRFRTADGFGLSGVRVTEDNLLGSGQTLGLSFYEREVAREYGAFYYTPQVLGTRWDLRAELGRTRPGTFVRQELSYPYVGEVSKWAGRQSFHREDRYFDYLAGDDPGLDAPHILLPLRDQFFDAAVVRRIGQPGNMALVGAALTYEELSYPGMVEVVATGNYEERVPADSATVAQVAPQARELNNIRGFLLLGHRSAWWVRRRGFDSMRGQEDVRLGAEVGVAIGRSLPSLEADDDLFATLSLYSGIEAGDALLIGRARLDSRRDLEARASTSEWEDVYLDTELLTYLKTAGLPRHTFLLRVAGFGGWHTRTPFQLSLGGLQAVRGYDPERFPGGRRLVVNLEDRFYIGWPLPDVLDMGGTVFIDAGRSWAGDVPFGTDSGWKAAAGVGLRTSFPAGGRSTYRLDVAWPIEPGAGLRDFKLILSLGEVIGLNPRFHDEQLLRSRPKGVAGELFPFK